jgi:membrane-associated phospholipid phosphatase
MGVLAATAAAVLLVSALARAEPPVTETADSAAGKPERSGGGLAALRPRDPARHRLRWNEDWQRHRPVEYVTTSVIGIGALAVLLFGKPSDQAKWVGPILFDSFVRDALRVHSANGLTTVRTLSNIVAGIPVLQAVVLDSVVLPLADGNVDIAWQMSLMNAQAFGLSTLVVSSLYETTGRARPSYRECQAGTSVDPLCRSGTFATFPSGHTATALAAAGLICAHHAHLPLYGSPLADGLACAEGVTFGVGTAVLRLMGDRHYASDVLVGGGFGFLCGFGLPNLLHYTSSGSTSRLVGELWHRNGVRIGLAPGSVGGPIGATAVGQF